MKKVKNSLYKFRKLLRRRGVRGMPQVELIIQHHLYSPLKKKERNTLIAETVSAFESAGVSNVKVMDSYYEISRTAPEIVYLGVVIQLVASIVQIIEGIKNLVKKRKDRVKEIRLKNNWLRNNY